MGTGQGAGAGEGTGRGPARAGLEHWYPDLVGRHGLRTIGDALALCALLQQQEAAWAQLPEGERRTRLAVDRQWRHLQRGACGSKHKQQGACVAGGRNNASASGSESFCTTPIAWSKAAEASRSSQEQGVEGEAPTERDALLVLLPRLGWQVPGLGRMGRTGLRRLTVRLATVLQLTVAAARSEQHAAFIEAALEAPLHPPAKEATLKHLLLSVPVEECPLRYDATATAVSGLLSGLSPGGTPAVLLSYNAST